MNSHPCQLTCVEWTLGRNTEHHERQQALDLFSSEQDYLNQFILARKFDMCAHVLRQRSEAGKTFFQVTPYNSNKRAPTVYETEYA